MDAYYVVLEDIDDNYIRFISVFKSHATEWYMNQVRQTPNKQFALLYVKTYDADLVLLEHICESNY
jgi:hypothetical protein